MVYSKKLLVAGFFLLALIIPNVSVVSAATPDYSGISPEVRVSLLLKLIEQLTQLQARLKALQEQQIPSVPTVQGPVAVTAADYTRGSVDAPIKIVTFTDLDCPFCKMFHSTLATILETHTDVSVTYRHFPLVELHPNAKDLAIAAECAGQIGGDKAFWSFVDSVFASREVNEKTDMSKLSSFAAMARVPVAAFASCRTGATARLAVEADMADGEKSEVQGTPQSFILRGGKPNVLISGAQPLGSVEAQLQAMQSNSSL